MSQGSAIVGTGNTTKTNEFAVGDTSAGNATQLDTANLGSSTPCRAVRICAPTTHQTENTDYIYIKVQLAPATITHADALKGAIPLHYSNYEGVTVLVDNANRIYLAGYAGSTKVEYQIIV